MLPYSTVGIVNYVLGWCLDPTSQKFLVYDGMCQLVSLQNYVF